MAIEDKYALITGSSRGIGRGIALALAESGVKIGVHYFQNDHAANETLEEVRKRGSEASSCKQMSHSQMRSSG
jgi:3-oxoacyl-[acyl-carrier protein] reductase